MRILFCNIAYMQFYDYLLIKETPRHGGKYVSETGDAFEKYNFHVCGDKKLRGFVETKYINGYKSQKQPRKLRIENMDPAYKNADRIDNVTVVFCAYSDKIKKTVIVGWYIGATVYRGRLMYHGRQYNLECAAENGYLLPEGMRTFVVPRAVNGNYGFGQSNTWFARDERATEFLKAVVAWMESYAGASLSCEDPLPQVIPQCYQESGIGAYVLVNKYERSPLARQKCLEVHGTSCLICGFNAADVYGDDFADKIEVHHIVPIHEINATYRVNPEKDLIPVCPNCHTMLHTKMKNGEYPTVALLKTRLAKCGSLIDK